jgi:glycosyltransferase involved in cell wall biosynthesis
MSGRNVWILNHYAKTPDMPGGTRHYDMARHMAQHGFDVTIFASGFDHKTKTYMKISLKEKYKIEYIGDVRFVWVNTGMYVKNDYKRIKSMFSYMLNVIKIANKFNKPNIIIGSSMHPFAVVAAWLLSKRYRARFFFEVRDLWPQTAIDMGIMKAGSLPAHLLFIWERFMFKQAEKIIVLLPNAVEYITKRGISNEKILWISNGVDLKSYENIPSLLPDYGIIPEFNMYKDKFKVAYAGAHGMANGLDIVIDTAFLLQKIDKDIQFFLIGDGPEKENLMQKAKKSKIENVCFMPSIPKKDIPSVLSHMDAFLFVLLPLNVYKYGISLNKIFDYLACSKPILMCGAASNNIIEDAKAGITVQFLDSGKLAEAIVNSKNLPAEQRIQMGKNGYEFVQKYYSSSELAKKLIKVL